MNKSTILYKTLARALSMKRPHNSEGTKRLTDWLEDNAPAGARIHRDAVGNLHIDTRLTPENRTLFTAHVDTVHRDQGANKIRKTPTHWLADGACLGADDGAGCAMLMHLLHAGVPAYYLFTQGEECGGIGAAYVARDNDFLREFDRAIAFDRRGIDSVITHQGFGRCCSDSFADALAAALSADDTLMYSPDSTGVYTDTAEFTDIISECTNISIGYQHEHSERESLDIIHLQTLANRVVLIDWDGLPTSRDPLVKDNKWDTYEANSWYFASASDKYPMTDEEWAREALQDAIYDAMAGSAQWLIELMCESVYPEDPDAAAMFIDRNKLHDEELLGEALSNSNVFDPDTVLYDMFDRVYKGV